MRRSFEHGCVRLTFGATRDERERMLPGDGIIERPQLESNHAVIIDAAPSRIWPWLIQIGHERAGFYSDSAWWDACVDRYYRLLDRGVGYRVGESERIMPQWQHLEVDDVIADGPPGTAYYRVRHLEANRALVLFSDTHLPFLLPRMLRSRVSGRLSDALLLEPIAEERTRVLRRLRARCEPAWFQMVMLPVLVIWGEQITARRFLRGLTRRAEGHVERDR